MIFFSKTRFIIYYIIRILYIITYSRLGTLSSNGILYAITIYNLIILFYIIMYENEEYKPMIYKKDLKLIFSMIEMYVWIRRECIFKDDDT